MSKSPFSTRLEKFVIATTGRNMTKAAYVAVTCGVAMMVLLTVEPAYSTLHAGIDALLWVLWRGRLWVLLRRLLWVLWWQLFLLSSYY